MEKRKRQKYAFNSNEKKITVPINVPEEIHALIVREAEEKSESTSKIVAEILEEFYNEEK